MRNLSAWLLILLPLACSPPADTAASAPAEQAQQTVSPEPSWQILATGSEASLRGLSALDASTAWATGTGGTILRTLDGGSTWSRLSIPGTEELDFRDVEVLSTDTAVLMTAGQPARIYRTQDGGESFELVHESSYEGAFFDSLDFWDEGRGLVFSDPVEGRFLVLETSDGGRTWTEIPPEAFPAPLEGEAGFAASGSNLTVAPGGYAWIGTGGSSARILFSEDFGRTWKVAETPLLAGLPSAGIFSVAFRDPGLGLAAGGDYQAPESTVATLARTTDGGKTWSLPENLPPSGHRAAVAFVPGRPSGTWISVGRAGSDVSTDDGESWKVLSEVGFYTLAVPKDGSVWAAGSEGRVAKLGWGASPEGS